MVVTVISHALFLDTMRYLSRDAVGLLSYSALLILASRGKISDKMSHVTVLVAGILMVGFSLWEELIIYNEQLSYYYQILFLAAGLTLIRLIYVLTFYVLSLIGFTIYASVVQPTTGIVEPLVTFLIAAALGLGCFAVQQRVLRRQYAEIQFENDEQALLREALRENHNEQKAFQDELQAREAELEEYRVHLEKLNHQEFSLKQELMHSQAMDSIGRLAGGLAHELNNSITVIRGLVELNQDKLKSVPDGAELVSEIQETLSRGGELAGRLVTVSGNINLHLHPLTIGQLLNTLKKLVGVRRLEFLDIQADAHTLSTSISVDEGAWLQTLNNLLLNAWDASPPNSTVQLSVIVENHHCCFRVKDFGSGIAPEHQPRIFEPYFTTKERGAGTGLGLPIAHGVVEKHSGTLVLERSDEGGTVFCARIPLGPPAEPVKASVASPPEIERKPGVKVLFVEDEEAILRVAKRHLSRLGFDVTATTEPREALALLERERYDIVVSDVVMPDLDGPGLIRQARLTVPDLKVIFVSGYTDDRLRGTGLSAQGDAFLRKPYTIPELARLIDETVG